MNDNDEAEQEALFEIEGPDEDRCVWLHAGDVTVNLGPKAAVIERFAQWLASMEERDPQG